LLFDTYTWIEFFKGTEKGEKARQLLKKEDACFTCAVSLSELAEWALKNGHDADRLCNVVKGLSVLIAPDEDIFLLAGKLNFYRKRTVKDWGMIDSLILATARIYGLKIVTGDRHFEKIEGTILI
jgi:predicted nucleic acid-binding protein